jgi:hypothetical protein
MRTRVKIAETRQLAFRIYYMLAPRQSGRMLGEGASAAKSRLFDLRHEGILKASPAGCMSEFARSDSPPANAACASGD